MNEKYSYRADGGLAPTEGNDDGIVGGPRTPQQIAAQKRLQQTQAQVDEVSDGNTQLNPPPISPPTAHYRPHIQSSFLLFIFYLNADYCIPLFISQQHTGS